MTRLLSILVLIVSTLHTQSLFGIPNIFPIQDVVSCNNYVLLVIPGSGLSPSAAYFSGPMGTGHRYIPGDTIHTSGLLYAYDRDTMGVDEECFFIQIIDQLPDLNILQDATTCEYYILPYFETPSISGYAGYYTAPGATGVRFQQGDTVFISTSLYAYDGYDVCAVEKKLEIVIHNPVFYDTIPHQYGCHTYTFIPFPGENIFQDSQYFLLNGITYFPGDSTDDSGWVTVRAKNGYCHTEKIFQLTILEEIVLDPPADTLICGAYLYLPEVTGSSITENVSFYSQGGGQGKAYKPGEPYNALSSVVFLYDEISGTNCKDEHVMHIDYIIESRAYSDFEVTVCHGYDYDVYDLLLARNLQIHDNIIYPVDDQIQLSNERIFKSGDYNAGEYVFFVVDSSGPPCVNDTALMTVTISEDCKNHDYEKIYCTHIHKLQFLLFSNVVKDGAFCVGGYFLDENFGFAGNWNDEYELDRNFPTTIVFYYLIENLSGTIDTSKITIYVQDAIEIEILGADTLCKGECTILNVQYLDDDKYSSLFVLEIPDKEDLFKEPIYFNSLSNQDFIYVCFLNERHEFIYENPDTIFLPYANQVYNLTSWVNNLKECQYFPDEGINILTKEENTFLFRETLCPGDSVLFEEHRFDTNNPKGEILLDIPAENGCDSFIYVDLKFRDPAKNLIREEICNMDTVVINCIAYYNGFHQDTQYIPGATIHGCDSMIIIDLNFSQPTKIVIDTIICEGQSVHIGDLKFSEPGSYSGIIRKQNLCDSIIYDLNLDILQLDPIVLDTIQQLCFGDSAVLSIEGTFEMALWSTGKSGDQIIVTVPGVYSVQITHDNGCTQVRNISISPVDQLHISGGHFYIGTIGNPVQMFLTSNQPISNVMWSPSINMNCDTCLNPLITTSQSEVFTYTAYDINGCSASGEIIIEIALDEMKDLYIPNIFNPKSVSGTNRFFFVYTRGQSRIYELTIFDRWGEELFYSHSLQSNETAGAWDGQHNGKYVQSGVYTYKVKLHDSEKPIYGTITVLH